MSTTRAKRSKLNIIGRVWVDLGHRLGLVHIVKIDDDEFEMNNLTNLNLTLKLVGPVSERNLTIILLGQQIFGVFFALFIRYYVAHLVYQAT